MPNPPVKRRAAETGHALGQAAYTAPATPAPAPRYWTAADEARLARRSRLADARRTLNLIDDTAAVAVAIRVAPSTVRRWCAGSCTPTVRHWRQLRALRVILNRQWWSDPASTVRSLITATAAPTPRSQAALARFSTATPDR